MRPILFELPALPSALLPILWVVVIAAAGALGFRNVMLSRRALASGEVVAPSGQENSVLATAAMPFVFAVPLLGLLTLWTHHAFKLHSYGVFLFAGFVFGTWTAYHEAKRRGLDSDLIIDMMTPMLLFSVIACRLLYVVLNRDQFHTLGDVVRLWDGGLSFHGALIGGPLVVAYFSWSRRIPFAAIADTISPSVFLGNVFGRIGCFMNGCCYGTVCTLPWGVHFDAAHDTSAAVLRHPAQLYSAALSLILFFVLRRLRLTPSFQRFPGQTTLAFFGLYAVERAIMEVFRTGETARTVLGTTWLTQAQVVSIIGLCVVAGLWMVLSQRARHPLFPSDPVAPLKS